MIGSRVVSVHDLKRKAKRRLPSLAFDYVEGGTLDEHSLRANYSALADIRMKQRAFTDKSGIDTSTTVLGASVSIPVFVSPMGLLSMFHPGNDQAVARAVAKAGALFVHSAWSGVHLDEVVKVAPGRVWEQIAIWSDPRLIDHQLAITERAGVDVIVVPADVDVHEKRERDLHHGLAKLPPWLSVRDALNCATKPQWVYQFLTGPKMTFGNFTSAQGYIGGEKPLRMNQMRDFMHDGMAPSTTWQHVERLRERWKGKVVVKGLMSAEDAKIAASIGVDGVIVSNHGGRQFATGPGTTDVLPEFAAAVGDSIEVYCDGGVTRGGDILKMVASGAKAVGIGRTAVWGLAAGGHEGVVKVFEILADELETAMAWTAVKSIDDVDSSIIINR